MVAQTLYDYREYNPTFNTGIQAIARMPEFCAPITAAIMMWPLIEQSTLSMLASIVGAEAVTVVAMHAALLSDSSKEQTLEAAAKTKLSQDDFLLLKGNSEVDKSSPKTAKYFCTLDSGIHAASAWNSLVFTTRRYNGHDGIDLSQFLY